MSSKGQKAKAPEGHQLNYSCAVKDPLRGSPVHSIKSMSGLGTRTEFFCFHEHRAVECCRFISMCILKCGSSVVENKPAVCSVVKTSLEQTPEMPSAHEMTSRGA
mmetsp:Transcript_27083/g.105408  ORF Transcript_27083/g.105408 Transcript_27083/m.105408 type:complete len:105 (+) Transcript_27083:1233-1547(+)